ncbi:MAG: hypothetical protein ACI85O_001842 [Saprospiraceae bacterium]|jgi:hypothetical protein
MINEIEINASELDEDFVEKIKEEYGKNANLKITVVPADNQATDSDFWEVISKLDWSKGEDDTEILQAAIDFLSQKNDADIIRFTETLAKKLYDLDYKKYAKNLGKNSYEKGKGFSADNFLYARACVVANGFQFYEKVKNNPEKMPKSFTFEALLYLEKKAWYQKNNSDFSHETSFSYETFSNPEGWSNTLTDRVLD